MRNAPTLLITGIAAIALLAVAVAGYSKIRHESMPTTFDDIERFKAGLMNSHLSDPAAFSITGAARALGAFKLEGGFSVCSNQVEIESQQYLDIPEFQNKLSQRHQLITQMNGLLESDLGITDCQYRVLEALVKNAQPAH